MSGIIYDCAGLASCASSGGVCFCSRRLAGYAPFNWAMMHHPRRCGGHAIEAYSEPVPVGRVLPAPTLGDLLRAAGVRA